MFNKILVPVDLSTKTTTQKLCQVANDLAKKYQSEVAIMTVIPDYGMPLVASYFPEDAQDNLKKGMLESLEKLAEDYFEMPVEIYLRQGKRRKMILQEIEDYQADLVMLGCRRKKSRLNQRLLGATGTAVSDRANCSVMIVR